jgi:hypothetical protein
MSVSNSVALAATIGGPAVAGLAVIVTARNSRGLAKDQREHERKEERSKRLFDARVGPYEELLRYMHHSMLRVDRTEPIIGPVPEPPEPVPTEEALQVQVRASMFGSPANTYRAVRDQGGNFAEAAELMHDYRQQAGQVLRRVENMIRDELAGL